MTRLTLLCAIAVAACIETSQAQHVPSIPEPRLPALCTDYPTVFTTGSEYVLSSAQIHDYSLESWVPADSFSYHYSDGALHTELLQTQVLSEWMNRSQTEYAYYDAERRVIVTRQRWSSNGYWMTMSREIFQMDEGGAVEAFITESASTDSSFIPSEQRIFRYDSEGRLSDFTLQRYGADSWENNARTLYSYGDIGYLDTLTWQPWSPEIGWHDSRRIVYHYDEKGRVSEITHEHKLLTGQWQALARTTVTYDPAGRTVVHLDESADFSGNWTNKLEHECQYDEAGRSVQYVRRKWFSDHWGNEFKREIVYENNEGDRIWTESEWELDKWMPSVRHTIDYVHVASTAVDPTGSGAPGERADVTLTAYPNPFQSNVSVSLAVGHSQDARVVLFDMLGRERAVLYDGYLRAGHHTLTVSEESLAAGIYFIRMIGERQSALTRIVRVK